MALTTTALSLISLALILPSTLALPFDWSFFRGKEFEHAPWSFEAPDHRRPHAEWSYTMTATTDGAFPTAPTAPTAYSYLAAATGVPTGTGTVAYPTATGYWKRDNVEEREFEFPPHFTGMPTFSFLTGTALPTGIAYPYPVGTGTGTGFSWPTSFPDFPMHEHEHEHWEHEGMAIRFGGPRHHFDHFHFPYRPGPMPSEAMPTMPSGPIPTGTAVAYYPTGTAPSWSMPTGYPFPTGVPW